MMIVSHSVWMIPADTSV